MYPPVIKCAALCGPWALTPSILYAKSVKLPLEPSTMLAIASGVNADGAGISALEGAKGNGLVLKGYSKIQTTLGR